MYNENDIREELRQASEDKKFSITNLLSLKPLFAQNPNVQPFRNYGEVINYWKQTQADAQNSDEISYFINQMVTRNEERQGLRW